MLQRFICEDSGQGLVEYGLLIALIALGVWVAVEGFGESLLGLYDWIKAEVMAAVSV